MRVKWYEILIQVQALGEVEEVPTIIPGTYGPRRRSRSWPVLTLLMPQTPCLRASRCANHSLQVGKVSKVGSVKHLPVSDAIYLPSTVLGVGADLHNYKEGCSQPTGPNPQLGFFPRAVVI